MEVGVFSGKNGSIILSIAHRFPKEYCSMKFSRVLPFVLPLRLVFKMKTDMDHWPNDTDGKTCPPALCGPQVPHEINRDGSRASAVTGRLITA
jgi:hypothetical protein